MFQVWLLSKQAIVHSREITIKEKEKGENKQTRTPGPATYPHNSYLQNREEFGFVPRE